MPPSSETRPSGRAARACARCRAGKIKCRSSSSNNPRACDSCERIGVECVLLPTRKDRATAAKSQRLPRDRQIASPGGQSSDTSKVLSPIGSEGHLLSQHRSQQGDLDRLQQLYTPEILMQAVDAFFQHFYTDILFSLHEPSVRSSAESGTLKPILAIAILTLTARFIPELVEGHGSGTAAGDYFADQIRIVLLSGADKPSLEKINALLFLSLHEWGSGRGGTAFIYVGLAIRTGLLLRTYRKQTPLAPPFNKSVDTREELIVEESRVRVWWSMQCMECLLSCGKHRGTITYGETNAIDEPCDEATFLWGDFASVRLNPESPMSPAPWSEKGTLIHAIQNWNMVNRWVSSDGVKKETEPPWSGLSRFAGLQRLLFEWEHSLPPKYRFDHARFLIHGVNKQAGSYGFLHLVYFSSVVFLHREYLQFFPDRGNGVLGRWATSADHLSHDGHHREAEEFREKSLNELFTAASRITEIIVELEARKALMITPFLGFAAFTAATMNMYLAIFGWLCPALAPEARRRAEMDVRFLKQVAALWPVAQKWYAAILRLFDSYRSYHMEGRKPQTASGEVIDTFYAFDRALTDYGEIEPDEDLMAAIVAAKDSDGYKHGIGLEENERSVDSDGHQVDQDGFWSDLTSDVWGTLVDL